MVNFYVGTIEHFYPYKPWLKPKPSLAELWQRPKARLRLWQGLRFQKPSPSRGFQAEPSCNITICSLKSTWALLYSPDSLGKKIHHSLEGGWTIGETKVHHKQLIQASVCAEISLPLIALSDTDIIVSPAHVELGEIAHTLEVMD
jgi:hypothetical protein